jgi:murein DD-endopeptidase MepM/ murein hydrolase activator NlpD
MAGYPARAAADGQVVYTGYKTQWGYFAVLKHSGCATVYAHLLRLPQKQEYTQGEVFAYTGASGFVTGPHLHFEVRIGGKPMDPGPFIGIK